MDIESKFIHPDQLCIGLFVYLDTSWFKHSFTFSSFEIKTQKQIDKIRELKLTKIRYSPLRSKSKPLKLASRTTEQVAVKKATPQPTEAGSAVVFLPEKAKLKLRADRLVKLNKLILECKEKFEVDARITRDAVRNFAMNPQGACAKTEAIVADLVTSVITERDVALHAVTSNSSDHEAYVHSLNVTVLALMLAKSLDMSAQDAHDLGIAAMLHDVGKTADSRASSSLLDYHCQDGARMARDAGLSERIGNIILQHHEFADGTGYPNRLSVAQIDPLARLLSIVNFYDNLCNPNKLELAMSPHEALAYMFSQVSKKFDTKLLQLFIRSLGVYPPGSIVQLSNNVYGIVITTNPNAPMLPYVMIYAPHVPMKTQVIIDLSEEEGLTIKQCVKANDLPIDVRKYFAPRSRTYYYILKNETDEKMAA